VGLKLLVYFGNKTSWTYWDGKLKFLEQ